MIDDCFLKPIWIGLNNGLFIPDFFTGNFLMRLEIKKKSRINPESAVLREFCRNVTSQCGEDGIIEKIFDIVGMKNQYCVEFGAWDGKLYSNTWNLINHHGWAGLLIEADDKKFKELKTRYAGSDHVGTLNTLVETAGERSLDAILAKAGAPRDLDFLCIDVDGIDWHIWNSLTNFEPRLILAEFNPTVPNDVIFIQDDDASINRGASLLAFIELGKSKGYELVASTDWNGFFVKKELFPYFGIKDNDIDAMHDTAHYESRLFQCYDGTLVLAGCKKLLWSNVEFDQEDIQVLPVSHRKFNDEP